MRVKSILNRDSGTLKTLDIDDLSEFICATFAQNGHQVDCEIVSGPELPGALERAMSDADLETVVIAGGDGTVSNAAASALENDKTLGVLPAGTMNLFARKLAIPEDLREAVCQLAAGQTAQVSAATVNGETFIYHVSVGFQTRIVLLRQKMQFASRWGKIWASVKAFWQVALRPPRFNVSISIDGQPATSKRVSGLSFALEAYQQDEQRLGVFREPEPRRLMAYVVAPIGTRQAIRILFDTLRKRVHDNEFIEVHEAQKVRIELPRSRLSRKALLDGEVKDLPRNTELALLEKTLTVLVPESSAP